MLTDPFTGPTTDANSRRQAVPSKARELAGAGAEGAQHGDERLRFARRSGSCLHLLETAINRPRRRQGNQFVRTSFRPTTFADCCAPRLLCSPSAHQSPFLEQLSHRRSSRNCWAKFLCSQVCTTNLQRHSSAGDVSVQIPCNGKQPSMSSDCTSTVCSY